MGSAELGNLPSRTAHSAPDVEHPHPLLDAHRMGQIVFVPGDGLVEVLAEREAAKMEALAPAVLVNVRREVVVADTTR